MPWGPLLLHDHHHQRQWDDASAARSHAGDPTCRCVGPLVGPIRDWSPPVAVTPATRCRRHPGSLSGLAARERRPPMAHNSFSRWSR